MSPNSLSPGETSDQRWTQVGSGPCAPVPQTTNNREIVASQVNRFVIALLGL